MAQFDELEKRIASRFARLEAKEAALAYIKGLIGLVERKNSWQLAEAVGDKDPYRFQHLLNRASWYANTVRDDLRDYVVEHLGDDNAVLIVDETGFLKKGNRSVGVQRQYSGTAGRTESRFYTDGWGAYERKLDPNQHQLGKANTQKIERKHLTLRTRIKRLVRRTICLSKSEVIHDVVIGLYINRYEFGLPV